MEGSKFCRSVDKMKEYWEEWDEELERELKEAGEEAILGFRDLIGKEVRVEGRFRFVDSGPSVVLDDVKIEGKNYPLPLKLFLRFVPAELPDSIRARGTLGVCKQEIGANKFYDYRLELWDVELEG